jgi:hypothetical protein
MDDRRVWEGEAPIQGLNSDSSYLIQSSLLWNIWNVVLPHAHGKDKDIHKNVDTNIKI